MHPLDVPAESRGIEQEDIADLGRASGAEFGCNDEYIY
jgi:hypothetical protein